MAVQRAPLSLLLLALLLALLLGVTHPRSVTQEDVDRLLQQLEDSYRTQIDKDGDIAPDFRNALSQYLPDQLNA